MPCIDILRVYNLIKLQRVVVVIDNIHIPATTIINPVKLCLNFSTILITPFHKISIRGPKSYHVNNI